MAKIISRLNQVRCGAVLSYVNMAIGSLIPMFYTPIMLQLLGQSEYGLFKLASSVTSYFSLISFGIGSALVRYFTKYRVEGDKDGEENVFGLFNIIFWIISGITLLVGIIITLNLGVIYSDSLSNSGQLREMKILVFILTLTSVVNFICSPNNAVVTAHEKFLFLQCINILTTVVIPVVNIVILYCGFKSIGLVCSSLFVNILIRVVYIIYVRNAIKVKPKYNNMPKHLVKEILLFSFWMFVAEIASKFYGATDNLIIGAIPTLSTIGVAVYSIGATFNTLMCSFSTGLISVLTPKVNAMVFSHKSNTEITDLMIRIGRIQCYIVLLVCSGFISFGRQFIQLWAGAGYGAAYWIAIVTMIPSSIPLLQNVALNVIIAQNKHRFRSIVYLGIAFLNVIGTILCVNTFGIIGAAIMTGIATLLGQGFVMNWYYYKKIHIQIPRFWKSILNIFPIPIFLCLFTLFISNYINLYNWISLGVGIVIYVIIFIALSWMFVMTNYEKDIFRAPLRKNSYK